ncbi:methylated-DNA--[protein]-cysteine S-methyltransferase, partial [Rhizobiaceae sp. 2RAB30]
MIAIVDGGGALVRLDFHDDNRASAPRPKAEIVHNDDAVAHVQEQITAFFRRELRVFDLPLAPIGNAFLLDAWSHLTKVAYGTTTTYGALAQRLTKPTSARAMGRANA